jgi:hypothetical protein
MTSSFTSTTRSATAPGPAKEWYVVNILKQRILGTSREFLIEWEGFPEVMQTWEPSAQYEKKEWRWLVENFFERCSNERNTQKNFKSRQAAEHKSEGSTPSNNEISVNEEVGPESESDDGDGENTIWKTFDEVKIFMDDKRSIQKLRPLYYGLMDYAMAIIAQQTKKFKFLSCICPITGYPSAIDEDSPSRGHASIHHCGDSHEHWIASFLQRASQETQNKNIVWVIMECENHPRLTAKVVTEITDLYFVECSPTLLNRNVRLIPMKAQIHPDVCGYLAIATVVEVVVGGANPAKLYLVEFDEDQISNWLLACIEAGKFTLCPKKPNTSVPNTRDMTWNSKGLGYLITEIFLDFIILQQPPQRKYRRMKKRNNREVVVGKGRSYRNSNRKEDAIQSSLSTAPAQQTQRKIIKGIVIQLLYTCENCTNGMSMTVGAEWAGNWVVTEVRVRDRLVQVRPVQDDNRRCALPSNFLLRIISPPCLFVEEFFTLNDYELIADDKKDFTLVYPVSECKLSDAAFATKNITRSVILEITPCNDTQDVESMLAVLSNRRVWMYVRIQDLLPYRNLTLHVATVEGNVDCQQSNALEMYHKQLDWILLRSKVDLQMPVPGTHNRWYWYDMHNALIQLGVPVNEIIRMPCGLAHAQSESCLPRNVVASTQVSADTEAFPYGTKISEIMTWGARQYGSGNSLQEKFVLLRASVPDTVVVRTTVLNDIVTRQEIGLQISVNDAATLIDAALFVTRQVGTYISTISMPEAGHWGSYRFDVALNDKKAWFVVDVSTWEKESMYKRNDDNLQIKGIIALGGNKTVLLAHERQHSGSEKEVTTFAMYKLRDPTSKQHEQVFRNDITIHRHIKTCTRKQPSSLFLKMYRAWTEHQEICMTVESMQCNVRTSLKQSEMTFGK